MNIPTFFRFLNKKIQKYDKAATNPFAIPHQITILWIEDTEDWDSKQVDKKE